MSQSILLLVHMNIAHIAVPLALVLVFFLFHLFFYY